MCLIVSEGNSPDAIRLHLEEVYDTFTEDRNIFSALEFIAKNVEEAWSVTGKMDETKEQLRGYINNYEEAKKHLQIVLSDPDVESVLANSVVTQVGAFNAQYRLPLDSFNLESEMSVHVTKNTRKQSMYRISVQNNRRNYNMNKDDFMKFVEENIKYHLPESFADCIDYIMIPICFFILGHIDEVSFLPLLDRNSMNRKP